MLKILYFIYDTILFLILGIFIMLGMMFIGILPMLIGFYTPLHWVSLLTFISGPYALVQLFELGDKITDWYEDRQTLGKQIDRGI